MSSFPNVQSDPAGAIPVWNAGTAVATDGVIVDPNGWAMRLPDEAPPTYQEIQNPDTTDWYRQTFTYYGDGNLHTRSQWVKQ